MDAGTAKFAHDIFSVKSLSILNLPRSHGMMPRKFWRTPCQYQTRESSCRNRGQSTSARSYCTSSQNTAVILSNLALCCVDVRTRKNSWTRAGHVVHLVPSHGRWWLASLVTRLRCTSTSRKVDIIFRSSRWSARREIRSDRCVALSVRADSAVLCE